MKYKNSHPYHLVMNSPWPAALSMLMFNIMMTMMMTMYNMENTEMYMMMVMMNMMMVVKLWMNEIKTEGFYSGEHTTMVSKNLLFGFFLFVMSEMLIFISLFFAYFYNSLIPSIEIGNEWPPLGISILNPLSMPLYNTMMLYISGITMTMSQNKLEESKLNKSMNYLMFTMLLGLIFSYFQYIEYLWASFSITDSIYSTIFYILTGFHGIHVLMGTFLLIMSLLSMNKGYYNSYNAVFYTAAAVYWHFVDYVWLILYMGLYTWGS